MIRDDSRKVKKGDIFIALNKNNDGHNYVLDAIKNGATSVIVEHGNYNVETKIVNDTHEYLVNYLKENYYEKIKNLKLIGVTGTNGKTTTCFLLYQALNNSGIKCAYIGTIGFYMDGKVRDLNNTTPDILELYEILLECAENNVLYVVMEVSSQALSMNRVEGLEFMYGVFTNLTQDHLDYHQNMENYLNAKLKLFEKVTKKTFVNVDDRYFKCFLRQNSITYGFNKSDYQIEIVSSTFSETTFKVNNELYKTSLIGKYNLYNLLVVISILKELNIKSDISLLLPPPGRMSMINYNDNLIIIDYAHTPDAMENVIKSVRALNPKRIITLIGCGGNRDKGKRPIMGRIATELSDIVIFTSDNPRDENPKDIIKDMLQQLDKKNYKIIINRKKAIIKGIQTLQKNDILLLLGKGHETYQIIKNKKYDFDDKKIVLDSIWR